MEVGIQVYKDKYANWEPHIFISRPTNGHTTNGSFIPCHADKVKGCVAGIPSVCNLMVQADQVGTMAPYQGFPRPTARAGYDIKADFSGTSSWGSHFFWGETGRNPACP